MVPTNMQYTTDESIFSARRGIVPVEAIVNEEMKHVTELQEWARTIRDSLELVESLLHTSRGDCERSCSTTYDWLTINRRWRIRRVDASHPGWYVSGGR